MGMHFGLVAIKASVSEFKSIFPTLWPAYEITSSAEGFSSADAVWAWMKEHEKFVSAAAWTRENPGTHCIALSQDGPWAVMMDSSYVLASDENALKRLSEQYSPVLSFVVESAGGCAFFTYYDSGRLCRSISNAGEEEIKVEGTPLTEEKGIALDDFYMDETEALMRAFGLSDNLPIVGTTIAIALTDRTDYSNLNAQIASQPSATRNSANGNRQTGPGRAKPWWKFW